MEILIHKPEFYDLLKPVPGGCIFWMGTYSRPCGYGVFGGRYVHRMVLEHKLGRKIKPGFSALHSCNNKSCVKPEHLYEGSGSDNARDRLDSSGINGYAKRKLTVGDVKEIRSFWSEREGNTWSDTPMSQSDLAAIFGVTRSCIAHVLHNNSWRGY